MAASPFVEPFVLGVSDTVLADLRARIGATRWPGRAPALGWAQGTELDYLRQVCTYWADEFDWRAQERWLNTFAHFRTEIDGVGIHFVHHRAAGGGGVPLILTHGWPSSFVEYLPVVPLLTDAAAYGIDGPGFDVVIPSLPGYGFSDRPPRAVTYRDVARLWHRLMSVLGYERYGCGGGDFGSGVATVMALDNPDRLVGLHLTNLELDPAIGAGTRPLSAGERRWLQQTERWWHDEGGYKEIQGTRPQTLGYALNDSPAGLAAWILEKWRAWGDAGGDLEARFSRDLLLTVVTLYWVTETITSSIRDYYDNRQHPVTLGSQDYVTVPTAVACFADPAGDPPREWAERLYTIHRWTPMPSGGHFAPAEEPALLARDLTTFFAGQ
ncbi:MAG: epoxide hydrolase family protein [Nocardioidaceae bacterium]